MLKMSADNVLVVMAVYYCVAGLALIEYYLRKLHLSRLMRVLFYILLFLTQLRLLKNCCEVRAKRNLCIFLSFCGRQNGYKGRST